MVDVFSVRLAAVSATTVLALVHFPQDLLISIARKTEEESDFWQSFWFENQQIILKDISERSGGSR